MNQVTPIKLTVRTVEEAQRAVNLLRQQFGRECQACYDGLQYDGDPASKHTPVTVCPNCNGTGRRIA